MYSNGLIFNGQQYDISCTQAPVIPSGLGLVYLTNKYNVINFKGTVAMRTVIDYKVKD